MEHLRSTWLVFRMHLRSITGSRRTLAGIVLAAIPPLLGVLAANLLPDNAKGEEILAFLGTFLLLLVIVPLLGIALGVGVVSDEAEGRTITYPFTRPIPRASFFLGRWLATLVVVLALLGASAVGLAMAASMRAEPPSAELAKGIIGATLLGGTIYSLGAAVIGVLAKRGLVVALGYAFAIEGLLTNVPGSSQKLTVQYHLRSLFIDKDVAPWNKVELLEMSKFIAPDESLTKLTIVAGVLLVLGCWVVTRKQFVLSS